MFKTFSSTKLTFSRRLNLLSLMGSDINIFCASRLRCLTRCDKNESAIAFPKMTLD